MAKISQPIPDTDSILMARPMAQSSVPDRASLRLAILFQTVALGLAFLFAHRLLAAILRKWLRWRKIGSDRVGCSEIGGIPTIGVRDTSIQGWNAVLKRAVDIGFCLMACLVGLIPMVAIALLIKRDSEGPVFYRQTRVGQYGTPFTMIKFRCMVDRADAQWPEMVVSMKGADGRLFKDPDDPRITRVGRVLRRYSLDELPQLMNVMRGEMSIVGPRPPLPREVSLYDEWHMQRLLVRPGLTGLWQVNGRSHLSFDEMVRLDLYYAENWTSGLDIKILLRTVPAVILGRGAY